MFRTTKSSYIRFIFVIVVFILSLMQVEAQTSDIRYQYSGIVTDSTNGEGIPFASVYVQGTIIGTVTDEEGRFLLRIDRPLTQLSCSFVGYKEKTIKLRGEGIVGNIRLAPDNVLEELVVKNKRVHYKRKNNPSVDFVKRVLEHKDSLDARSAQQFHSRCYKKQTLAVTNADDIINKHQSKGRNVEFLKQCVDTSEVSQEVVLPLYTEEVVSDVDYVAKDKKVVTTPLLEDQKTLFEIIPEDIFSSLMSDAGGEINIYDNSFRLLFTDFVSPIASYGNSFYHYYITDTLRNPYGDSLDYIKVNFAPTNKESLGFAGYMLVAKDSSYGIKELEMSLSHASRINFVSGMVINQSFERTSEGFYTLRSSRLAMEGSPIDAIDRIKGLYARIERYYAPYYFGDLKDLPSADSNSGVTYIPLDSLSIDDLLPDNAPDRKIKDITDLKEQLGNTRMIKFVNFTLKTLADGHVPIGGVKKPKFHLGPIYSITTKNHLEGRRFLLGAQTGTGLNKRVFGAGYVAYGLQDEKFKGWGEVEVSFIDKERSRTEFPRRSIIVSYLSDCDMPSNRYATSRGETFLSSMSWQTVRDYSYYKRLTLTNIMEFDNGFSYNISVCRNQDTPADELVYVKSATGKNVEHISTSEVSVTLGYQPNVFEQFGLNRFSLTNQIPHITLKHTFASDKVASDYSFSKTELGYDQRFSLSPVGYMDVYVKGGKAWSKSPYPLLFTPPTNLSYICGSETFAMMSSMEFLYDQYAMIDVEHYMEGWLLAKIPLVKKLKLREFWKFKIMASSLSDKNNPALNPDDEMLFALPKNSYVMNKPYMEASFGIYNIFKLLQVEFVRRLSYLDNSYADKWGFRFGMRVGF